MAAIRQKNNSWQVYWRAGGRDSKKQTTAWPTIDLAEQARAIVEAVGGKITGEQVYTTILGEPVKPVDPGLPQVREWAQTFRKRHLNGVSVETREDYDRVIDGHILPSLGNISMSDGELTRDVIAEWMTDLCAFLAPATVRKAHALFHQMCAAAVPQYLAQNPCAPQGGRRGGSGLPTVERAEMVFLTPAENTLLVAAAPAAIRDLVEVDQATGLRQGEIFALQVGDVIKTSRKGARRTSVRVQRSLKRSGRIGPPKTKAGYRTVSVVGPAEDTINHRCDGRSPGALLFPAPGGGLWNRHNFFGRYWQPAVVRAQRCAEHPPPPPVRTKPTGPIPIDRTSISTCACPGRLHKVPRFHDLRHSFAAFLIEAGWNPLAVQRTLGHASIQTTFDIYGHLFEFAEDDRLAALARFLVPAAVAPGTTAPPSLGRGRFASSRRG